MDATVKLATAAPDGVNRSSGSAVRLPMTVMTVSPAMGVPSCRECALKVEPHLLCCGVGFHPRTWVRQIRVRSGGYPTARPGLLAQNLGPQHRVVQQS